MKKKIEHLTMLIACICMATLASGCSTASSKASPTVYKPVFYANNFSEPQQLADGVEVDTSESAQGYAGVSVVSEKPVKALMELGDISYTFDIKTDGSPTFLSFSQGSGLYRLRIMECAVDNKYFQLGQIDVEVDLADEFQPFLHSSVMVNYDEQSECVKKAGELAAKCDTDFEMMQQVYKLVCEKICYDEKLAAKVNSGYIPDPDRTLASGKGICIDYAALAAAMLRSQGIPAKLITGFVGKDALYHAWNEVYLQDSGWISVELRIPTEDWTRIDLTFAAAGMPNGSVYVDKLVY